MRREHARLATCLGRRQEKNPQHCTGGERIGVLCLPIGRNNALQLAPELIHRAEFRRLFGQPEQLDPEGRRPSLGRSGRVRTRAIQQEPDGARPAVVPPQLAQESLRIDAARLLPREHHAVRGPDVDRSEQQPLRVLSVIGTIPEVPTGAHAARSGVGRGAAASSR